MFIDYSKIITSDFKLYITEEKLAELKEVASKEKTYLKNRYHTDNLSKMLARKAEEVVYINARHQLRNNVEKALIASEIAFDNQKFANILRSGDYDLETLQTYINLLNYLKSKVASDSVDANDDRYLTIADNFAKRLVSHFIKHAGVSSQNIIINKINEILSFAPELLESNHKQNKH